MNILKIVGGAAVGIVAIVASPFFGAVGAVSLGGAALGAGVGAACGALREDSEEDAIAAAEMRGHALGKAEHAQSLQAMKSAYENAIEHMTAHCQHVDLMLALFGVGVACAAHSGSMSAETVSDIKEIVGGLASESMPANVQAQFDLLQANPPSLSSAFARAHAVSPNSMQLFDDMVAMVAALDCGATSQDVMTAWAQLRCA